MIFLVLAIIFNVAIFALFRIFPRFKVVSFQAIVINYMVCVATGLIFTRRDSAWQELSLETAWLPYAIVLGAVFVATFYSMSLTTTYFSITVSSIASKISLVVPVFFTLFIFELSTKTFDLWNYIGVALAVVAIFLSSSSKPTGSRVKPWMIFLPLIVFVLGALLDTMMTWLNANFIQTGEEGVFPVFIFATAACIGLVVIVIGRKGISRNTVLWGILLGLVNYFSVFYILRSLTAFQNDGALVFPILNMGIILGSMLASVLFFGEKLTSRMRIGILSALLAIYLISYQELMQ